MPNKKACVNNNNWQELFCQVLRLNLVFIKQCLLAILLIRFVIERKALQRYDLGLLSLINENETLYAEHDNEARHYT